jgi:hypothetical protein
MRVGRRAPSLFTPIYLAWARDKPAGGTATLSPRRVYRRDAEAAINQAERIRPEPPHLSWLCQSFFPV